MNKKIIVVALVVALVLIMVILLFFSRSQVEPELIVNENEQEETELVGVEEDTIFETEDFSVLLPEGWHGYEGDGDVFSAFLVTGTEEEMALETVWTELTIQKFLNEEKPLAEHMEEIMGFLEEQAELMGEDSVIIKADEERTVLDLPARYLEMEVNWEEYQSVTATTFFDDGEYIWNIGINLPVADWTEGQELFDRVVASFGLK